MKMASKDHAKSRWLPLDRGIGTLDLSNGDELEFRSTSRPVKVQMPDGATKVVQVRSAERDANGAMA